MAVDADRQSFVRAVDSYKGYSLSFLMCAKYQGIPSDATSEQTEAEPPADEESATLARALTADRLTRVRLNPQHPLFDHATRTDRAQTVSIDSPGGSRDIPLKYRQTSLDHRSKASTRRQDLLGHE